MSHQPDLGPFCQSCAMPMTKPDDFGTDAAGHRVNDYCHYCYAAGAFTEPHLTMQQMVNRCVAILASQQHMREEEALALIAGTLPLLKRWAEPSLS